MSGRISLAIQSLFTVAARQRCMTNLKNISIPNLGKTPTDLAAVLVPLCRVDNVPSLLYTVRSSDLRSGSGEISFPGGKSDPHEDAVHTALRETEEEIGLLRKKIDVWGKAPAVPGRNNKISITPVIGSIEKLSREDLCINEKEVAEVFTVPIELLCDPNTQFYTQYVNGFILPVFVAEQYKVWGVTAFITHNFLSSILPRDVYKNDWMKKKIIIKKNPAEVPTEKLTKQPTD